MKASFKSRDFFFRPTTLGAAFAALGVANVPLVREAKREGLFQSKTDKFNREPSVKISPIPSNIVPPREQWKSAQRRKSFEQTLAA